MVSNGSWRAVDAAPTFALSPRRDISLDLVASPSLWAFAFSQGRDFVAFLKAFQAMRSGFASGSFRWVRATSRKASV